MCVKDSRSGMVTSMEGKQRWVEGGERNQGQQLTLS